jgi:F-type H+-transporting ATPase subunit delta
MTAKSLARQYADAAFVVAQRNARTEPFGTELQAFVDLVTGHAELGRTLGSAAIPKHAKRQMLAAILERSAPVSGELQRLLELLADNDRLALLPLIADAYRVRAMDAAGVVTAHLVTAAPLDATRQDALAHALSQVTGRRVEVTGRVDDAIIGGVIARVGSTVYDGSVSRQLERMRQQLNTEA